MPCPIGIGVGLDRVRFAPDPASHTRSGRSDGADRHHRPNGGWSKHRFVGSRRIRRTGGVGDCPQRAIRSTLLRTAPSHLRGKALGLFLSRGRVGGRGIRECTPFAACERLRPLFRWPSCAQRLRGRGRTAGPSAPAQRKDRDERPTRVGAPATLADPSGRSTSRSARGPQAPGLSMGTQRPCQARCLVHRGHRGSLRSGMQVSPGRYLPAKRRNHRRAIAHRVRTILGQVGRLRVATKAPRLDQSFINQGTSGICVLDSTPERSACCEKRRHL
jgi:hypothetical protein